MVSIGQGSQWRGADLVIGFTRTAIDQRHSGKNENHTEQHTCSNRLSQEHYTSDGGYDGDYVGSHGGSGRPKPLDVIKSQHQAKKGPHDGCIYQRHIPLLVNRTEIKSDKNQRQGHDDQRR